ncbi:hypothetical protein HDU88_003827 [Geranomyces variabilis]|nr:hypothetical protein HDU88_003827 [Geranomyces variabilis]
MNVNDVPNLDLDQFLGVTQADLDLYATPFDSAIAAQDATAWIPDNEMLDQLELLAVPSESAATSPGFSSIHDPYMYSPASQACDADAFFNATSPVTSVMAGDFGVAASPVTAQYQESPIAQSLVESPPQFGVPVQAADQGWGFTDEGALFPALYSPSAPAKPIATTQVRSPVQQAVRPAAAIATVKPIAPMPSSLLPLLNTIGPTAAQLALSPAALAAASAATGVDVKQLQQQLQAFAAMQARQTTAAATAKPASSEVAAPAATPATAATNRKRKERPVDADALFAELDMKRQKNTEAARRSRQKKQERMAELAAQVKQLETERDLLKAEKEEGAVREMNYLAIISAMQQKLSTYAGAS